MDRNRTVYHYTTGEGLKGIVESKSLWATGAYYLNDTSEIEYGCRVAASVLEDGFAAAQTALAKDVLRHAHAILSDLTQRKTRIVTLYVACFCESDNLLSQWRTYSRSGGFALGFRVGGLQSLSAEFTTSSVDKVLYEKHEQVERIRSVVASVISILGDDRVTRGDACNPAADDVLAAGGEFARFLLSIVTRFKAPDFAEEQEWRLVCQPQYANDSQNIDVMRKITRFRTSSRGLLPYIELKYRPNNPNKPCVGNLPLESVRFGPTETPDLAQNATRMLLDANGFQNVRVDGSDIPVIL